MQEWRAEEKKKALGEKNIQDEEREKAHSWMILNTSRYRIQNGAWNTLKVYGVSIEAEYIVW